MLLALTGSGPGRAVGKVGFAPPQSLPEYSTEAEYIDLFMDTDSTITEELEDEGSEYEETWDEAILERIFAALVRCKGTATAGTCRPSLAEDKSCAMRLMNAFADWMHDTYTTSGTLATDPLTRHNVFEFPIVTQQLVAGCVLVGFATVLVALRFVARKLLRTKVL